MRSLIIALIILLTGTVIYAAYSKSLSNTLTIIEQGGGGENVSLEFYQDPGLTTPISSLAWGMMEAGDTAQKTFYIKNTGDPVSVSPSSNLSNQVGTVTVSLGSTTLNTGQSTNANVSLSIKNNAAVGSVSFSITITAQ